MKTKTITLTEHPCYHTSHPSSYRVEKVTDTVEFKVPCWLTREMVQELCANPAWKVTILSSKKKGAR